LLVDVVKAMAMYVDLVFDHTAPNEPSNDRSAAQGRDANLPTSRFERSIGNLFTRKKVLIFDAISGDRESILLGILKICLKSLQECVRLKTLSRHGYQQIQLDLHFLAHSLRPLASKDEPLFNHLLEEILSSAAERCVEAHPAMELSVIESICQHKLGRTQTSS
jgi:hypothetical protein